MLGLRLTTASRLRVVLLMRAIEPDIRRGAAAMQQVAEWLEKLGRLRRGRARCRSRFQGTLNRRRKGRISGGRGRQPCTRAKDWSARSRS